MTTITIKETVSPNIRIYTARAYELSAQETRLLAINANTFEEALKKMIEAFPNDKYIHMYLYDTTKFKEHMLSECMNSRSVAILGSILVSSNSPVEAGYHVVYRDLESSAPEVNEPMYVHDVDGGFARVWDEIVFSFGAFAPTKEAITQSTDVVGIWLDKMSIKNKDRTYVPYQTSVVQ